jgi:hypothetical protein
MEREYQDDSKDQVSSHVVNCSLGDYGCGDVSNVHVQHNAYFDVGHRDNRLEATPASMFSISLLNHYQ